MLNKAKNVPLGGGLSAKPREVGTAVCPCSGPGYTLPMVTHRNPPKATQDPSVYLCPVAVSFTPSSPWRLPTRNPDLGKGRNIVYSSIQVYEPSLCQTYGSQRTFLMPKKTVPIKKATRNPWAKLFSNPDFHLSTLPIKLNCLCKITAVATKENTILAPFHSWENWTLEKWRITCKNNRSRKKIETKVSLGGLTPHPGFFDSVLLKMFSGNKATLKSKYF